jgi:flagellin-like hook-associated protein FlgL
MAKGVVEKEKLQILLQASQAILVQANQFPDTVLELLK